MRWEHGPPLEEPRAMHCAVQLNDCEVALMGGIIGDATHTDGSVSTSATDSVTIYNFETKLWRAGPDMKEARKQQACGALIDPSNGHRLIISACSTAGEGGSSTVEIWDTITNEIYYSEHSCPEGIEYGNFNVSICNPWKNV